MEQQFRRARRAGVPILGIETQDQPATIREIVRLANGGAAVVCWDLIRGLTPGNEAGQAEIANIMQGGPLQASKVPGELFPRLHHASADAIVVMQSAHRIISNEGVSAGVAGLREVYKANGAMLVLLGPSFHLPVELQQDVMTITHTLPDVTGIREIITRTCTDAEMDTPADLDRIAETLIGLSSFAAEQTLATCIYRSDAGTPDIDRPALWERKCRAIEQTAGLKIGHSSEALDNLKDLDGLKTYLQSLAEQYACYVLIDEISDAMAGVQGDTSGVSQDIHGTLLTWMESQDETDGLLFVGHPGTGKTAICQALGNQYQKPFILFDLSAVKGSLVGQTGQQLRSALKVIDAISQGRALIIATCNSLQNLSPQFLRRFTLGTFFFELPTTAGRAAMLSHYAARYGIDKACTVDMTDWTGAEIKQVCRVASKTGRGIDFAARFITPVARRAPEEIMQRRAEAVGRLTDARTGDLYRFGDQATPVVQKTGRKLNYDA